MSLRDRIAALSRDKRALLAQRNPLSFSQQRLWFIDQLEPGDHSYNIPLSIRLDGPLSVSALAHALTEIVRRHQVLRAAFPAVEGQPLQVVLPPAPVPLPVIDLRGLPPAARPSEAERLADLEACRCFDLAEGPLLRMTLLILDTESHVGLITAHHIATDGWSFEILIREMGALYAAAMTGAAPLPALPVQYADFSRWQRKWLQGEALTKLLDYWRQRLAGLPPVMELPIDLPRPARQVFRGSSVTSQVTGIELLRSVGRDERVTLFMTLLAAFQALLYRYTGERDVVVGSPMVNRNRVEFEGLIGLFQNTLVLRTDLSADPDFRELLGRVRETVLSAHAHQDLPFEKLVDELQPERALDRHPLFQVMFTLKPPRRQPPELAGLRITPLQVDKQSAKFDLTLSAVDRFDTLTLDLEYSSALFLAPTAARMLAQYEALLCQAVADPGRRISELRLLSEAESHQILNDWNDTGPGLGAGSCMHELFEETARQRTDVLAMSVGEERLTYGVLDRRANQLARFLRRQGVGAESRVGICLDRSVDMVVAALAVLKAGGAYVPLDPSFPRERLALMLEDAGAVVVLTSGELLADLPSTGALVVRLESARESIGRESGEGCGTQADPGNLAYLIYTSGSTGRPKGVEVPHRGVVSFLRFMARELAVAGSDVLVAVTTFSFDIAVLELFLPLVTGARLDLVARDTAVDGQALAQRLSAVGATLVQATPATWQLLLDAGWEGAPGLRILCGGEALPPALARELQARSGALWNVYGPTETTIWSTIQRLDGEAPISLGQPLAGTRIYLVGEPAEPAPIGVAGELCIGGVGVARGYHGQPALTAERFVPDPFAHEPGQRMYRTGDLARHGADGRLEFLGRVDHQVKVRGFRIEPGEVEARLREHPGVREAVVAVRSGEGGYSILVAWLVPREGNEIASRDLRAFLREALPDYMVPSAFVALPALPRTPNGKVDRRNLPVPEPEQAGAADGSLSPRTPLEEVVAGIWAEVLGRREVGARDNFFDLGGHSLLATQIVSRLRGLFRVDLPLRSLFEGPTVAEMAARIDLAGREGLGLRMPPLERVARGGDLPLSFPQQRLWFLSQLEPGNPFYNLSVAVRLSGQLGIAPLTATMGEMVRRHEALRTVFPVRDGRPVQQILPASPPRLPLVDLEALPESENELASLLQRTSREPFELAEGPLLRVLLLRLSEREHVIVVTMHHIVGDRWSLGLFVSEVVTLYRAFAEGAPSPLPELPVQYADFAHWQRDWLQGEVLDRQLAYWRRSLVGSPDLLRLPTDWPRPPLQTYNGARKVALLPLTLREALHGFGRGEGATLFMVLFAGFKVLLHWFTKQEDIVVGANVANRTHRETEGLIGFFANLLPLRTDLGGDPSFRALLGRVREAALGAYAHQEVPFERVVEELQPKRDLRYSPLVQVVFSFQNVPMAPPPSPDLRMMPLRSDSGTSKFDLTLDLVESAEGIVCTLEYNRDLFKAQTIVRLIDGYRELLETAVASPDLPVSALEEGLAASENEKRRVQAKQLENQDALMLRDLRKRSRQPAQAS
jgi:amino acid adenylation domain-containing protein